MTQPRLGAHMSVAGGLPLAVARAVAHRCDTLQIFSKNASQWRGRVLPQREIDEFRSAVRQAGLNPVVSHASYLINLASAIPTLRQQSIDAMADEIDRAEALGLLGVVLHPGCATGGSVARAIELIGAALCDLLDRRQGRTMVLIEQTAGQGTAIGASFEQLAAIVERMNGHPRVGICLDTCHLFASGYDIATPEGYATTFKEFERLIGLDRLQLFHLNDSRKPLGSRVDRHAHIRAERIGIEAFRRLVTDVRFRDVPMLLETPKESRRSTASIVVDRFDERNLAVLRGLITE